LLVVAAAKNAVLMWLTEPNWWTDYSHSDPVANHWNWCT